MLTPQDVQEKQFTKAVFGGYDMATVDDFLETLSADYAALYKENAILKSKMKVLVDKVEEYRSTEDAMRAAFKTAQKTCDDMISEAQRKSDNLVADAEAAAAGRKEEINRSVLIEEKRLDAAKAQTAEFVDMVKDLCSRHLDFLGKLGKLTPEIEPETPAPISDEERISETAKDIENSISKIVETAITEEPEAQPAAQAGEFDTKPFSPVQKPIDFADNDEPTSPRPKFDFSNLQFGSNYDKGE